MAYQVIKSDETKKYITKAIASTSVVINGDAITAGSNPIFLQ